MANVYLGNSKALVFPVMSDGYLKIPYADSNISTSKGNLWNLSEGFVIEALITPYDVNGNTTDEVLTSTKTVPIGTTNSTQSGSYFSTNRYSHKTFAVYVLCLPFDELLQYPAHTAGSWCCRRTHSLPQRPACPPVLVLRAKSSVPLAYAERVQTRWQLALG